MPALLARQRRHDRALAIAGMPIRDDGDDLRALGSQDLGRGIEREVIHGEHVADALFEEMVDHVADHILFVTHHGDRPHPGSPRNFRQPEIDTNGDLATHLGDRVPDVTGAKLQRPYGMHLESLRRSANRLMKPDLLAAPGRYPVAPMFRPPRR